MAHDGPHSPPITSVGAGSTVGSVFNLATGYGTQAFGLAFNMINDLSTLNVEPINFDTSFTVPDALVTGFERPERPVRPSEGAFDLDVDIPSAPSLGGVTIPNFGSPPEFDREPPTLNFGTRPAPFEGEVPDDPPDLFPVAIPDDPTLEFPALPELEDLNLPEPPTIIEHEFDAQRPVFNETPPNPALDYEYQEYSSELLDSVRDEVARMLQGGTGLPPAIEQMLFDRSRTRNDAEAERAVSQAVDEWAARGHSLPSGIVDRRIRETRQRNQEQNAAHNRDLTIRVHETEIENLRFAVQQGVALENVLAQIHIQSEELQLRAAQVVAELILSVFRAKVEIYNAEVNAYRVDADVFRELVRAELSKAEVYRTQIEAERIKGELNRQLIDLYRAQLDGVNTLVAVYTARVQAAGIVAQTNESQVRSYMARIDAYRAQVQAKESEFNAWVAEIQGELGKVQGYEAETRAFAARTGAYEAGVRAQSIGPQLQIESKRLQADQFRAQIEGVRAEILAESQRVNSLAQLFSADASIYAAEGQVSAAESDANTRQFQALLQEKIAESEQALKTAELNINQLVSLTQQLVAAKNGAGQAASNLAAASLSAINASASVSEQGSASNSWQQSYVVQDVTRRDVSE